MIKRRIILLILLTFLFSVNNIAKGQSYDIVSFQGIKSQISLYYKPFSGILKISCLKDSIFVTDYMSIKSVRVLNKAFLQITYVKRAGSNEDLMNTVLLCVDNGKLYQAMHINSFSTYDMRNISHIKGSLSEYQLFKLKVMLLGINKSTYKLSINIHDESNSERSPKTNHNYNKHVILRFDASKNIFYSSDKNVSKSFTIYDPKTQGEIKQNVNERLPVITLGKSDYYYIKDEWYEKGKNDNLLKYAYK